ncbi:gamma-glutamylcyclotransferase, partial [bacterium]|nr:gamma-glutamylcyclotransferase [bacterium]
MCVLGNLNLKYLFSFNSTSKYIGCYSLKNYTLVFRNYFLGGGVADVEKKKNSSVLGAIYKISKKDERELDIYEDFPKTYIKKYFR